MTARCLFLAIVLLLAAVKQVQGLDHDDNDDKVCKDKDKHPPSLHCGLYMAPSSIPNAGYGLYTGVPLKGNTTVLPLDLAIDIVDFREQMDVQEFLLLSDEHNIPDWLVEQYYWMVHGKEKFVANEVIRIIGGIGAMPNNHPAFVNIYNAGVLHHKEDVDRSLPQAGAFTPIKDAAFKTLQDIPAGHELSVSYGLAYFAGRNMPSKVEFQRADKVLELLDQVCGGKFDTKECNDLWQVIRHDVNATNTTICSQELVDEKSCASLWMQLRVNQRPTATMNPLVTNALPQTIDEVQEALTQGCAWHFAPNVIRSLEWLEENGVCLDHIESREESSISNAGSGAFAKRPLSKGSLVAPAPLIHMHRQHVKVVFADTEGQVLWQGHQLLMNYLYGHPSTSLLFFPYSPVVNFINHSPEPNVKLQWSSRMSHPEWLNRTTDQVIAETTKSGLMMEIVAIRDIYEGEEVFLNYGRDWEVAWKNHVDNWQAPLTTDTGTTLNRDNGMTVCNVNFRQLERVENSTEYICKPLYNATLGGTLYPCTLLSSAKKDNGTVEYTVDVHGEMRDFSIRNLARHAIELVKRPYTGNEHLRHSFRHEIQLPDDMIPASWRDLEVDAMECDSSDKDDDVHEWNDFMIPVRTNAEQTNEPYPDNLFIGCHCGSIPKQFGVETKWEYTSGMYDVASANVTRCEVLQRHGTDGAAVAHSIRPSLQTYTIRAWSGKNDWIMTDVPRRAIEFFDKEGASAFTNLEFHAGAKLDHESLVVSDLQS